MANQLLQFRTEKGKEGIGFLGHVYRFGKGGADGSLYWRCLVREDCKGRLVTDTNKGNPQLRTAHSHVANEDEVRVRCTREHLRLRAANESAPITQIYREEVRGLVHPPGAAAIMPGYDSVSC